MPASFSLPPDTILPVARTSVQLDPGPHPFESGNAAAIEEGWARASAANPALFDGEVALLSSLHLRDGVLDGRCHIVRYATFLHWRAVRPVGHAGHAYTHAMLVGSDNALVAIRMGPHTLNPGLVYFAAGSFEPVDFRDGEADIDANMRREVMEETGLELAGVPHEPACHVVSKVSGTVLFRRYFFEETGDALAARICGHVAGEADPEIEGPVVIRHAGDVPQGLAPQMPDLMAWHFGGR